MSRPVIMGSLWVVLGSAGLALAQDAPPLEPPAADSPQPTTSTPKPASVTPGPARSEVRPLLVIPGVTAPTERGGPAPKAKTAPPSGAANPPGRGPQSRPVTGPRVESVAEPSSRSRIPLTLEPIEDEPAVKQKRKNPTASASRDTIDWPPGVPRPDERPPVASPSELQPETPITPRSAPPRPTSFFGRLFGLAPTNAPRSPSQNPQTKSRVDADTRPDATTDTATRRKIENEIKDTLGDRLRSVEVRVSGRNVLIVARASRFWQKRSVRQSLETLPGLAGFRARVDILD
jgi:hypothetical protein